MKKIILSGVFCVLCFVLVSPGLAEAKTFKYQVGKISKGLENGKIDKVVDRFTRKSSGYLIGTFQSEGKNYSRKQFRSTLKAYGYEVLERRQLTKREWNTYFNKTKAKKRAVIMAKKVPCGCVLNPNMVVIQIKRNKHGKARMIGYLSSTLYTLRAAGLYTK